MIVSNFVLMSMLEQIQAVIDLMKAPLTQKLSSTILKSIMMNLIVLIKNGRTSFDIKFARYFWFRNREFSKMRNFEALEEVMVQHLKSVGLRFAPYQKQQDALYILKKSAKEILKKYCVL